MKFSLCLEKKYYFGKRGGGKHINYLDNIHPSFKATSCLLNEEEISRIAFNHFPRMKHNHLITKKSISVIEKKNI